MGASRVHTFLTDMWYDLQVFDVAVDDEMGLGCCCDRVGVVFLAHERRPSGGERLSHRGRPKACITLRFKPGWRAADDGTLTLLSCLGVPLPIPDNFDWERQLANRRIVGLFDAPHRSGARNKLRKVRPLDSPPEQGASELDVPELAPGPESPRIEPCLNAKPRWDADLRVLTWNNKRVGDYARLALNQEKILSAFEEEGWPIRIDDPLPPGRLRQTLKDLQKKFKDAPITFRADGTGKGIRWTIG